MLCPVYILADGRPCISSSFSENPLVAMKTFFSLFAAFLSLSQVSALHVVLPREVENRGDEVTHSL